MTEPMERNEDERIAAAFDSHSGSMLLYARQWVGATAAEDAVQRVFLKLIAGRRMPADFRTWLFRCVRNEAVSATRSDRRRNQLERGRPAEAMFVVSPDDAVDTAEVQKLLSILPPTVREVVTLRIWSELTFAEISAVTGLPLSTVHHQYKTALTELREKLEQTCKIR